MKKPIRAFTINSLLLYIWVILLVVDCFSLYYKIYGYKLTQLANIGISVVMLVVLLFKNGRIGRYDFIFLCYLIVSFTYLIVVCNYQYMGFITGCAIPVILYYLYFSLGVNARRVADALFCFENIILVIAAVSLLFYIFGTLLHVISPSAYYSSTRIGWADFDYASYYGVYFEGQRTFFFGRTLVRNIGFFVEAPIFAYVLASALYIELFFRDKLRKSAFCILTLTIITTFSTTALSISVILVFVYYYNNHMNKSFLKLFVPIVLIIVMYVASKIVLDKVSVGNDSGSVRTDDVIACLKAFADNPLTGIGYNNMRGIDPYRGGFRQNGLAGMSSGIPFVFASGGIVHGLIYVLPALIAIKRMIIARGKIPWKLYGFIFVQTALMTITVVEFTLLGMFFLALMWAMILHQKQLETIA